MKRLLLWVVGVLALAFVFEQLAVLFTPDVMMWLAMRKLQGYAAANTVVHGPRADETRRQIVMPSPDLLYSYCVYDLGIGPLRVHADIPAGTYWSVSAFDARTDNFYTLNDREAASPSVDLLLVDATTNADAIHDATKIVRSPSRRGILLFRTLVQDEARASELDSIRRRGSCTTTAATASAPTP